ncbi:ribonuclease T2-like [Rhizophlyctis rosea]|nr:ribonuclease T2-like [Rhizophlyctis rosea]
MQLTHVILAGLIGTSAVTASPLLAKRLTCAAGAQACDSIADDQCCVPTNGLVILALQWIRGYCYQNSCAITTLPNIWTLHGIWPDTCSGSQVATCTTNNQWTDVATRVSSTNSALYSNMNTYWVSYTGDNNAFWSHEWQKHGTCWSPASASCVSGYGADVDKYFQDGLNLRSQYDVKAALTAAGMSPGHAYSLSQYRSAITAKWPNIKANFICSNNSLYEIRLAVWATPTGGVPGPSTYGSDACPSTGVWYEA